MVVSQVRQPTLAHILKHTHSLFPCWLLAEVHTPPEMEQDVYAVEMSLNTPVGTVLTRVTATTTAEGQEVCGGVVSLQCVCVCVCVCSPPNKQTIDTDDAMCSCEMIITVTQLQQ